MKQGILIAAFAALSALAVAGWMRKPAEPQLQTDPGITALPATYSSPAANTPVYRQPARVRRVVSRDYVPASRVVKRERPLSHSVAIVGAGAGVGAAIGGLAGGGKGAGIGALSGGTAAFIYDRLTHNK